MRALRSLIGSLMCAAAACTSGMAGTAETAPPDESGAAAVEVGCPYQEPADPARASHKVTLDFRVRSNGAVDPASITALHHHHDTDEQDYIQRAREVARLCVYRPATVDGEPVASAVRKRFYFDATHEQERR